MTVNGRHETSFAYREVWYRKRNTAKNKAKINLEWLFQLCTFLV
jgi:hypothetical protein